MGVGLTLTGRLTDPTDRLSRTDARDWLARAAVWFEAVGDAVLDTRIIRDSEDRPVLLAAFHPAAEPIELRLSSSGRLKLSATTSPVGPGYHAYLCAALRAFADDFDIIWDEPDPDHDPGRFFTTGDATRLESHFLRWLSATCAKVLQTVTPQGGPWQVGMPRQPKFLHPGPVQTPLGPQPAEWLKTVAANPAAGRSFFPWWRADLDAAFYRGRALTELWLEFRWRPPLTEAEGEQVDQVAADLANAFDLDPTLDLPWAAWAEVIAAIEGDTHRYTVEPIAAELKAEVLKRAAQSPPSDSLGVGYRHYPIRANLHGGWHLDIPGTFATAWEDGRTWTAWDATRSVWFRGTTVDGGTTPPAVALAAAKRSLPVGEAVPGPVDAGLVGEAVFGPHDEDGKPMWRLSGVAACRGKLAACNVYVADPADHHWAVQVWQSLRHDERTA
jgi:hypothetical protein